MANLLGRRVQALDPSQLLGVETKRDLVLVGDDPWEVFVTMVRAIRILSHTDVSWCTHLMTADSCSEFGSLHPNFLQF